MNDKNFNLWMTSIDDRFLEEAASISKQNRRYRIITRVIAACLVLAAARLLFRHVQLSNDKANDGITREYFTTNGTNYTMLSCEITEPTDISGMEATKTEPLVWYAGGLELKLCSTNDTCWVSWYDTNTHTQWCLLSETDSLSLLTTAGTIVEELGYNVAVAPENATDITYNAFLQNNLTVAETTFLLNGVRYSYHMSSTYEVTFPFADISGTGTDYATHLTTEVGWCPAELYFTENASGKIIWFDIVPGLLYSLSMETGASEENLLSLAHELFSPAQDNAGW